MGALALIITLSSVGLPGLNGFIGEFTILLGAFNSTVLASPWFAGVATLGVILAAVYLLHMFQKLFLGPVTHEENLKLKDVSVREILVLAPILAPGILDRCVSQTVLHAHGACGGKTDRPGPNRCRLVH